MKQIYMYTRTYVILFALTCVILIMTSQKPITTTNKPVSDTTAIISKNDILSFNIWLRSAASFDQYTKLNPEQVTIELLNWKSRQLAADTTKKK